MVTIFEVDLSFCFLIITPFPAFPLCPLSAGRRKEGELCVIQQLKPPSLRSREGGLGYNPESSWPAAGFCRSFKNFRGIACSGDPSHVSSG